MGKSNTRTSTRLKSLQLNPCSNFSQLCDLIGLMGYLGAAFPWSAATSSGAQLEGCLGGCCCFWHSTLGKRTEDLFCNLVRTSTPLAYDHGSSLSLVEMNRYFDQLPCLLTLVCCQDNFCWARLWLCHYSLFKHGCAHGCSWSEQSCWSPLMAFHIKVI